MSAVEGAHPPPIPDDEINILTEEQIGAILRHLEGRTLRPIVSFLLGTGARRGEVLAVRWEDVNLQKNLVRIERSGHLFANTDARAAEIMEATFAKVQHGIRTNLLSARWQSGGNEFSGRA